MEREVETIVLYEADPSLKQAYDELHSSLPFDEWEQSKHSPKTDYNKYGFDVQEGRLLIPDEFCCAGHAGRRKLALFPTTVLVMAESKWRVHNPHCMVMPANREQLEKTFYCRYGEYHELHLTIDFAEDMNVYRKVRWVGITQLHPGALARIGRKTRVVTRPF